MRVAVILVVDANPIHRDLIVDLVRPFGHTVIHSTDGEDAIRLLQSWGEKTPDLIIVDYNMPKVNGLGLINTIRQREATKWLPVLMLTGSAQDIQPFVEARGVAFLEKGKISSEKILEKIRFLLDGA